MVNIKRGGKREGAGRPVKDPVITIKISRQVSDILDVYVEGTGLSKREIADNILFMSLQGYDSTDFIYCPKCRMPVLYKPIVSVECECDCECKRCSHKFTVEI